MDRPVFSIITCTYNRMASGYLQECLDSVKNQQPGGYSYEHIIVDDGSTDGTLEFLKEAAETDDRIKVFTQKNAGPAKAIQHGIKQSKGGYVVILDDDDLLPADSLMKRAKFIKANPGIDFFYGLAEWIDDFGLPAKQEYQSKYYTDHLYERMLISNCIHGGTTTIRATAVKKNKMAGLAQPFPGLLPLAGAAQAGKETAGRLLRRNPFQVQVSCPGLYRRYQSGQ